MLARVVFVAVAVLIAVPRIASAQNARPDQSDVYTRPESATPAGQSDVPDARLLAGVRAYPPGILPALFAVSRQPAVLRQLAEDPQQLMNPQSAKPAIPADLRGAISQLQQAPELVALAAAYPDEVEKLRQLYESDPQRTEQRLADLRARYDAARLQSSQAWQEMLAQNPAALDAYRDLVTQFTRDQLKQYREFPYVEVTEPQYFYAAPPNEMIMAYAQDRKPGAPLDTILSNWWSQFGPEQIDERVAQSSPPAAGQSLAAATPQERARMWQRPADRTSAAPAMMPIIMQPMTDQPADARTAYAVAENARLWSGPESTQLSEEPPQATPSETAPQQSAPPQVARRQSGPAPYAQRYADDAGSAQQAPEEAEQAPQGGGQGSDYEYDYAPEYQQPQVVYAAPTVYYSPLVPYYYCYPAVWPVAYSYYPGLYSYWPYYWSGPGAYFSFSFGYGAHYFHCGHGYWGHGYWGHWGHGPGHGGPYVGHYYGHGFRHDPGRHGGFGGGDHGRGGDRFAGGHGRGGDRFGGSHGDRAGGGRSDGFSRGGRSDSGRGDASRHGDRSGIGRGERSGDERFGSGGSRDGARGEAGRQFGGRDSGSQPGGRSFQGGQGSRGDSGSKALGHGRGYRQGGSSGAVGGSRGSSQGLPSKGSHGSQGFNRSSSFGSGGMGSVSRAPHSGGSGMSRGIRSGGMSGGHQMGSIRSGGFGGGRAGGFGGGRAGGFGGGHGGGRR